VVEPEFAQTLPKATARFNRRVEEHLRRWTRPSLGLRSGPCSWTRTQGRRDAHASPWRDRPPAHPGWTRPRTPR
jgi:hypothetical protein